MDGKKKPYKNRRKQYKHRKPYSSNRKKLRSKIRPTDFKPFSGYVTKVIDGDTIIVRGRRIRIANVNAPELDQPYGQKSKREMFKIVKKKKVYVVPDGTTSYNRIVAMCYIDGNIDIGSELIKRGLALDIPYYTGGKFTHLETDKARRTIKPFPNRLKTRRNNNLKTYRPTAEDFDPGMKNLKSIIAYHNFPQTKDNSSEETTADTDLIDYDDDFDLIDRGDR
jgi:endonuclease YncB( thermonuclease family)